MPATRSPRPASTGNTPCRAIASATGNVLDQRHRRRHRAARPRRFPRSTAPAGNVGTAVTGTYGSVTINTDGSYTYTLDNTDPDTKRWPRAQSLTDVFTYTVTDAAWRAPSRRR